MNPWRHRCNGASTLAKVRKIGMDPRRCKFDGASGCRNFHSGQEARHEASDSSKQHRAWKRQLFVVSSCRRQFLGATCAGDATRHLYEEAVRDFTVWNRRNPTLGPPGVGRSRGEVLRFPPLRWLWTLGSSHLASRTCFRVESVFQIGNVDGTVEACP